MALTTKQRRFADAKHTGATNKQAAEAAGYAASSASAAGSRLAKHPEVVAHLEKLKAQPVVNYASDMPGDDGEMQNQGDFIDSLPKTDDPLVWLLALMNEPAAKIFDRRSAAQKAVDYFHGKKAEQGKKEGKGAAAKQASQGKFGAGAPPLRSVK